MYTFTDILDEYDLIVLGGGSGGLAAAREAHLKLKKTVLVVDYVTPTPHKTFWREGGTCVNVGCIPKKLMHQASLLGTAMKDAREYGWEIRNPEKIKLNWRNMVDAVQRHVGIASGMTRTQMTQLRGSIVNKYLQGLGEFVDANTVKVTLMVKRSKTGELSKDVVTVKGKNILIAVGGRPRYPDIPGAQEYAISSDDLFSLAAPPGKTLVIGAGYIAMECAGFLNGIGMDVTVMVRNDILKKMDRQMVTFIKEDLKSRGVKFLEKSEAISIDERFMHDPVQTKGLSYWLTWSTKGKKLKRCVKWKTADEPTEKEDCYDTVLVAVGRTPETAKLQLEKAGVHKTSDGHIEANEEKTNVADIYAVGDVLSGRPELTPVAIQAGQLLVRRLFDKSEVQMDYNNVPTTVFTPLEYSFVGITEEEALKLYQTKKEEYISQFTPLEFSVAKRGKNSCFLKVITRKEDNSKNEVIVGMHLVSPSAGEVMQGFAAAMKAGLTFKQLQETVGIHPTVAEEFTRVHITKSSGKSPIPPTCCA